MPCREHRRDDRHPGAGARRPHQAGAALVPSLGPTRTEAAFAAHIARTIDTDPEVAWRFLADQRNTHQSESLVRLVAGRCGLTAAPGAKGQAGVLRSMASRAAFLGDLAHRIQFLYTPKRASWLNQIELWFSVLARRVLKRGDFASTDALRDRILSFIAYFNRTASTTQRRGSAPRNAVGAGGSRTYSNRSELRLLMSPIGRHSPRACGVWRTLSTVQPSSASVHAFPLPV